MIDIHIHTEFSSDGQTKPEKYIKTAAARGFDVIGFSDHCDYDMLLNGDPSSILDAPEYFKRLASLENDPRGVKILKGVELGYAVGTEDYYRELLSEYPFDYAIISVHGVPGRGDCYYSKYFDGIDKREAFGLYLDAVYKSVTSGLEFNVLGHLGYIARYAPYENRALVYSEFPQQIDDILRVVIERGAALELNTSTRGMDALCITPISVIERYIALGGNMFSFGSDAHHSDRYADKHDDVVKLLLSYGIDHTVHFERRRAVNDYFVK